MSIRDYYQFLGLDRACSAEDIMKTVNARLRAIQADINSPIAEKRRKAQEDMAILTDARRVLLNPEARAMLDRDLAKQSPRGVSMRLGGETPVQRTGMDYSIGLLLDSSGSMSGTKLSDAKDALSSFIDSVDISRNEIALVSFGDGVDWMDKLEQDVDYVRGRILKVDADGGTPMLGAIRAAHEKVMPKAKAKPLLVLASDGAPNDASEAEILEYGAKIKAQGTRIITIGIGGDVNDEFLKGLASSPQDYHFARASFELKKIYGKVVSGLAIGRKPPE